MDFVSVDVETATPDVSTICQIGVVQFKGGKVINEWSTYVNPGCPFDSINKSIHGIDESKVAEAPSFAIASKRLNDFAHNQIVACHSHFDRVSITRAHDAAGLQVGAFTWLDTARVARRVWASSPPPNGYGLRSLCDFLSIELQHHDALSDARAAGLLLVEACKVSALSVTEWFEQARKPISSTPGQSESIAREGNADGPLFGEVVVFTGSLLIPRREAADLAAAMGCQVTSGVTKNTSLLIVGDQDIRQLAGQERSSKHRKAERLIENGQEIRILCESDFRQILVGTTKAD